MYKYNVDFYTTVNERGHIGETTVEAENCIDAIQLATEELKMDCSLLQYQEMEIKAERIW